MKTNEQITKTINKDNSYEYKKKFSIRLKELREEQKLSQRDVAQKLGCAVSTYANWEQGRTEPDISDIYRLISVFDIDANELFN